MSPPVAGALLLVALGGCTVGPNFTPPKPPAIANWHDASLRVPASAYRRTRPSRRPAIPTRCGGTNSTTPR